MFNITYSVFLFRVDGKKEELQFTYAEDAWYAFRLFVVPDSFDTYKSIRLIEYNWTEEQEYPLAHITFLE